MGKFILFFFIIAAIAVIGQGSYFFWKTTRRRWKREDDLYIKEQKREALIEFRESQETLDSFINERYSNLVANRPERRELVKNILKR